MKVAAEQQIPAAPFAPIRFTTGLVPPHPTYSAGFRLHGQKASAVCQKVKRPHSAECAIARKMLIHNALKDCDHLRMVFHAGWTMRTTLQIDDTVMAQLKREAARQGRTTSELVETALRALFRSQRKRAELPELPTFHSGGAGVDVSDRDALYRMMGGR